WVHYLHVAFPPDPRGRLLQRLKRTVVYRIWHRAERQALTQARLVIANSETTRRGLLEHFGLDPARVQVVYYGVDPEQFQPVAPDERAAARARLGWPEQRPIVAFVGALGDHRKGFDTLYAAWQTLCR